MEQKVIVISGPSGAGKTTLYKHILNRYSNQLGFSVSATTRPPRKGEQSGIDYYFLSREEFQKAIDQKGFIEYENNYGNFYGTLKSEISRIWAEGKHCFLDVDVKGALNIKQLFPKQAVLIFIEPPSFEELAKRLKARGSDENLAQRLETAEKEMSYGTNYHHRIININLDTARQELDTVIQKLL